MWKNIVRVAVLGVLFSGLKTILAIRRDELKEQNIKLAAVTQLVDNYLKPMHELCSQILALEGDILRRGCKVGDLKSTILAYSTFLRDNASYLINVNEETDLSDHCVAIKKELTEYTTGGVAESRLVDSLSTLIRLAEEESRMLSAKVQHSSRYKWILEFV